MLNLREFFPQSVYFTKKKKKYKLFSETVDKFGTKICLFKKKENCIPLDTLKLYFPKDILKETTDLCGYCKKGYEQHHNVLFKNNSIHIQATCSECHRYIRFVPQGKEI